MYELMKTTYPISSILHHKKPALWSIAPEATVFEAIKLMAEKNIGSLLVMSGGKLAGIFTERDYTRKVALHGKTSKETSVWEIMPKELSYRDPERFGGGMHAFDDRKSACVICRWFQARLSSGLFPLGISLTGSSPPRTPPLNKWSNISPVVFRFDIGLNVSEAGSLLDDLVHFVFVLDGALWRSAAGLRDLFRAADDVI